PQSFPFQHRRSSLFPFGSHRNRRCVCETPYLLPNRHWIGSPKCGWFEKHCTPMHSARSVRRLHPELDRQKHNYVPGEIDSRPRRSAQIRSNNQLDSVFPYNRRFQLTAGICRTSLPLLSACISETPSHPAGCSTRRKLLYDNSGKIPSTALLIRLICKNAYHSFIGL